MKIHYLQHVPFESPANILAWAKEMNILVTETLVYNNEPFPSLSMFDLLLIMGGPMSVGDEKEYPWLIKEKKFIKSAISSNKKILGICLGAQLLAEALGSKVYPNKEKEIGWWPIELAVSAKKADSIFCGLPNKFRVFQWHGDTYDLPPQAELLASSIICKNQAFVYKKKIIGLQFHLESSAFSVKELIKNCGAEIVPAPYIQTEQDIVNPAEPFRDLKKYLYIFMQNIKEL